MASSSAKQHLPNDARLISLLLAAKGIQDADERVLYQLLDFAHRYTAEIITDATACSEHSGRNGKLQVGDVELAVKSRSAWEFEEGAPKDYLLPLAKQLNSHPLPQYDSSFTHIRLPPKHLMLGNANFRLVPNRADGSALGGAGVEVEEEEEEEEGSEEEMMEGEREGGDLEMEVDEEGMDLGGLDEVEEEEDGEGEGEGEGEEGGDGEMELEEEELEDNEAGRKMAEEEVRIGMKRSRDEMMEE